ncbi:hypothetical protein GOP47_0012053 [Adiantum capillus-veneris]|uniref:Chaperonin-like RBCX protein 1, chloroplastic n=1 Tax=Adiantum capillus-veneris TaxID=13818 RepID=A0A9D4UTW9_ADICA|nr:hypothetical protein GOP47_0012053 [Adiantum capillus-veneris]
MGSVAMQSWSAQPLLLRHLSAVSSFHSLHSGPLFLLESAQGRKQRRLPPSINCKMFVPGFGSQSPEAKAASTLHNYFTYLAVQIVLAQLEDYNPEAYKELREFVDRTPLNDGDKFCATLMRESPRQKGLAMRILEVRSTYASEDFEWDNVKKLAIKYGTEANTNLMREFLRETSSME